MFVVAVGCGESARPPADAGTDGRSDTGTAPLDGALDASGMADQREADGEADYGVTTDGATTDGAGDASAETPAAEVAPALPGTVTIRIVHDTEARFPLPELLFRVSVVGLPDATTDVPRKDGKYATTLVVPAGARQLRVDERTAGGEATLDYFQEATRTISVDVRSADNVTAEFHLKWHWDTHQIKGTAETPSCRGSAQLRFRDAKHGVMTVAQDRTSIADYPHGSTFVTGDGGVTWTVASALMIASPDHWFRPGEGNWWNNHHLLVSNDGLTLLSLSDGSTIARSGDAGKTWTRVFSPPTYGPGGTTWAGVARSGSTIYVGGNTGGVQGSRERTSISRSIDGGQTFQVILDRCESDRPEDSCSSVHSSLPLTFAGLDFACGPEGHCISLGGQQMLVTTDGFATYKTESVLLPGWVGGCGWYQTAGRVVWLPGTKTAWVVVNKSSCGNPVPMRKVTTDGGVTWGDWEPSPVSAGGFVEFADANTGFRLEIFDVAITRDGGKTFRSTGPAPHSNGTSAGFHLDVVAADHAFVTARPNGGCDRNDFIYFGAWNK